jgi:hypothetical protein
MSAKISLEQVENAFLPAKEIVDPVRFAGRRTQVEQCYLGRNRSALLHLVEQDLGCLHCFGGRNLGPSSPGCGGSGGSAGVGGTALGGGLGGCGGRAACTPVLVCRAGWAGFAGMP